MTKINLKYVDHAMMSNTEAIGRVKLEHLPTEVTGGLSAVEGAADMAYKALNGAIDLSEAAAAKGDLAAFARIEKEAGDLGLVWLQMEFDRMALLLHHGLSLQDRAVLEVYA